MAHSITREVKSIFKSFRSSTPEPLPHHPDGVLRRTEIAGHAATTTSLNSVPDASPESSIVLIELFQSQGCNSCPPANDNVISFIQSHTSTSPQPSPSFPARFYANRSPSPSALSSTSTSTSPTAPAQQYLLLTYQVTYWNYLGWDDTFSLPVNDVRQRDYVRRMGLRSSYTPMVVVNGVGVGVGNSKSELERIVRDGTNPQSHSAPPPRVSIKKTLDATHVGKVAVEIDATASSHSYSQQQQQQQQLEVHEVTYTPTSQDVHISRGENAGRTLPHLNVVKDVRRLGYVEVGGRGSFVVDDARAFARGGAARSGSLAEEKVVLVQEGRGGGVVGLCKI